MRDVPRDWVLLRECAMNALRCESDSKKAGGATAGFLASDLFNS
jgi:hypothetical protein